MNILSKVTWKGMWQNRTRTLVTIVGIILSAAMFMAVTTLGYSLWDYLLRSEIYDSGDYFLRFDYTSAAYKDALAADQRVSDQSALGILGYTTVSRLREDGSAGAETCAVAAGDAAFFDMVSIRLEEGRLPQKSSEIVITRNIYHYLKNDGRPCEIGETVRLEVVPEYAQYEGELQLPGSGTAFTKTYEIVGIGETFVRLNDMDLYLSHLFTYADAEQVPLWYRVYVKTRMPKAAYTLMNEAPEGVTASTNDRLLQLYGATGYSNYNTVILLICAVLAAIIMVGSVSLIYNAFSISVSERTKQFGLLGSIGATRKQLRHAVTSEAMLLSGIGIPLGLLSGYVGIVITLKLLSARIRTLLDTGDGTIFLEAKFSLLALAAAAVIALVTVLVSAAIPARRATRISPMDAIRQKNDYSVPRKPVRVGKVTYKLFGLSGVLSRKYYKISKKKYRATVISLVISVILFICAASISRMIHDTVQRNVDVENFDILCWEDMNDSQQLEAIRQQPFVEEAVYYADSHYLCNVPDRMLSDSFLKCWEPIHAEYGMLDKNMHDIRLVYLEDAVFRQYLTDHDLPEAPYFSDDIPSALVVAKAVTVYKFDAQAGQTDRYTYTYMPYAAEGEVLCMLKDQIPSVLHPVETEGPWGNSYDYYTSEEGEPILAIVPLVDIGGDRISEDWDGRAEYLIRWETDGDRTTAVSYFRRDTATGAVSAMPEATERIDSPCVKLGATVTELPFGISRNAVDTYLYNYLILPMSAAPEEVALEKQLCITVSDYPAARAYLDEKLGEFGYRDLRESQENNRTMILLINVFSYGFIILICLISVANVFNTISTNVALRRRDFGMLRSAGFREKDLLRMMNYECMIYGGKALLWGIPISLLLSYLIQSIDRGVQSAPIQLPWSELVIAALSVFLVVFITMFYAMSKLRRDNPMEAIRTENI